MKFFIELQVLGREKLNAEPCKQVFLVKPSIHDAIMRRLSVQTSRGGADGIPHVHDSDCGFCSG
jgi:hypothetical protein